MHASLHWLGIDLRWAYGALRRAIERRTRCRHRSADALHDAFVRLAVHPQRERIELPQAYFRRIVGSVLADQQRERQRAPLLLDDLAPGAVDPLALWAPSTEELVAIRRRLELLQRVLDALPPRCREVFWRFRVEGETQPEIAAALDISLNMVERHVMRALVDLRAARELLQA